MIEDQHLQQEILTDNIAAVRARIATIAQRSGRRPEEITLVAVSKTKPLTLIEQAYALGLTHFGENRVQELVAKQADFARSDLHWHLIGHLQSNKASKVVGRVALIHSVDSVHLAETLNHQIATRSSDPFRQPILLQVNISGEASKEGVAPAEAHKLAQAIAAFEYLEIQGLMTVAPLVEDAEEVRPIFRSLRMLRDQLQQELPDCSWHHLSMGMTDDYPVAIEEGATIVRIGRAIFGARARKDVNLS